MKIAANLSDQSVLREIGARLTAIRLGRDMTQAVLAEQAGVAKRTVERLESGSVGTQLSGFIRVCRVLGLLENFENLAPEVVPGPMEQLKRQSRRRQRASGHRANRKRGVSSPSKKWIWGDEA